MSAGFTPGWLVEALIASSLLMLFVLLVRRDAQRMLGPQLAYWLWALPALRLAMPPLPASWRESAAAPLSAASETVVLFVQPIMAPVAEREGFPWVTALAAAWAIGALGFFAWHGLSHFSYVRRIVAPPASRATLADGTTLVESDAAVGPVAFGVFKRFVAVPADFADRYDADERKLALAHELGHHARGDLIANWIALAMLAVHWFNPLAWVAYRKFRGDQEMANDARVLSQLPPIERHAYACAIVKAAHGRAVTAACHLHTIEDLKGRLRMLKASRKSRRVLMAGAAGIAGLTLAGLGLTASGAAAERIRDVAETQVAALAVARSSDAPGAAPVGTTVVQLSRRSDDRDGKVAKSTRLVIRSTDGQVRTYRDQEAEAYLAANPQLVTQTATPGAFVAAHPPLSRTTEGRRVDGQRLTVRDRNGTVRVYEGAEADAYLKANPISTPPLPPIPPIPPMGVAVAAPVVVPVVIPPLPPMPPMIATSSTGRTVVRTVGRSGSGGHSYAYGNGTDVVSGNCGRGTDMVRTESRTNGETRVTVCEDRIERYANTQARAGLKSGLAGIAVGRTAILRAPGMSDADRREALAELDEAKRELESEMRSGKHD